MSEHTDTPMQDLAAAYALGALSPEETRAFEAFLATSPDARREVAEYREVNALLAGAAPGTQPDLGLRTRVLENISGARAAALPWPVARRPVPPVLRLALAASLLLAALLGGGLYQARQSLAERGSEMDSVRSALAAVQTRLTQREQTLNWILEPGIELNTLTTTGTAEPKIQFFVNRVRRVALVHAFNLGPADAGKVYQLWFIQDGKPVPSVTFNSEPDGHALVQDISVPAGGGISHAAVTVEPVGGSPAPTSAIVLMGALKSS